MDFAARTASVDVTGAANNWTGTGVRRAHRGGLKLYSKSKPAKNLKTPGEQSITNGSGLSISTEKTECPTTGYNIQRFKNTGSPLAKLISRIDLDEHES